MLLAAKLLREGTPAPACTFTGRVGENLPRVDAPAKTVGDAEYVDDMRVEGLCFGSAVRSAYPRARVLSIDATEARALPGVVALLTADDLPGNPKVGHLKKDYDVLIPVGGITHFPRGRGRARRRPRTP